MPDDAQRPCARGEHCATRTKDGPALGPRAFCDADRNIIGQAITDLPGLYRQLAAALGDRPAASGPRVTTARPTPPIPINIEVDALMRDLLETVSCWDERVRDVARLSGPDTASSRRRRDQPAMTAMCATLTAHLDALLALPPAPTLRPLSHAKAATAPDEVQDLIRIRPGYATILLPLDGAHAGLELLALHHRARSLLGWTPRHEDLPVACWECGLKTLRRRDGASGLDDEATCASCGTVYTSEWYRLLLAETYEQTRRSTFS